MLKRVSLCGACFNIFMCQCYQILYVSIFIYVIKVNSNAVNCVVDVFGVVFSFKIQRRKIETNTLLRKPPALLLRGRTPNTRY